MKTPGTVKIGDTVTFVDERRKEHAALVTETFMAGEPGNMIASCINLLYVSGNEKERDEYGRQIKRMTSLVHASSQSEGNYWK